MSSLSGSRHTFTIGTGFIDGPDAELDAAEDRRVELECMDAVADAQAAALEHPEVFELDDNALIRLIASTCNLPLLAEASHELSRRLDLRNRGPRPAA